MQTPSTMNDLSAEISLRARAFMALGLVVQSWRFRWFGVCAGVLVLLGGWIFISLQADTWRASARVFINPPSEIRKILEPQIVDSSVEDNFAYVQEAMLGTLQLEKIARATGVYGYQGDTDSLGTVVRLLQNNISFARSEPDRNRRFRSRGEAGQTYVVAFDYPDPIAATEVVEIMLDELLQITLGDDSSNVATGDFLRQQILRAEEEIGEAERNLANFRRENLNDIHPTLDTYSDRLQVASSQLSETSQQLELARERLQELEQQLAVEPRNIPDPNAPAAGLAGQIASAEAELSNLRLNFTDQHPEVIRVRELLEALKARENSQPERTTPSNNPVYQAIQVSLNQTEAEIATLMLRKRHNEAEIAKLRQIIKNLPELTSEYDRLQRSYQRASDQHERLLDSLERENLSRLVSGAEASNFRLIDPPATDAEPSGPNRPMLMLAVVFAALGTAVLVPFAISQINPAFNPQKLSSQRLSIIGSISNVQTPDARRKGSLERRRYFIANCMFVLTAAGIYVFEVFGSGLRAWI